MFRIFQHTRKDAMNTRKTRKYLAYALGETALIVIGIIIALQITNMNDERRERQQEREYMASLVSELEDHVSHIDAATKGNSILLDDMTILLDLTSAAARAHPGADSLSESSLRRLYLYSVKSTYWHIVVEFSEGTIAQLKNAGGLAIIQDQDVLMRILAYDQGIRFCRGMEQETEVYFHVHEEGQKRLFDLSLASEAYRFIEEDFMNFLLPIEEFDPLVEQGQYLRRSDSESLLDYYNDLLFYRTSINNLVGCHSGARTKAKELVELIRERYGR